MRPFIETLSHCRFLAQWPYSFISSIIYRRHVPSGSIHAILDSLLCVESSTLSRCGVTCESGLVHDEMPKALTAKEDLCATKQLKPYLILCREGQAKVVHHIRMAQALQHGGFMQKLCLLLVPLVM